MRLHYYPESSYKEQVLVWANQHNLDNAANIGIADTIVAVVEKYIRGNPETFQLSTTGEETDGIDTSLWGRDAESLNGGVFKVPYTFPSSPVPNTLKMEPFVKRNLIAMILTRNRDYPASLGKLECTVGGWNVLFDIETRIILFADLSANPVTVNLTGPFPLNEDAVRALYFNNEWSSYALTPSLDGFKHICSKLANDLAAALPPPPPPPPPRAPLPPPNGLPRRFPGGPPGGLPRWLPRGLSRGLPGTGTTSAIARVAAAARGAPPPPPPPSSIEGQLRLLMQNAKDKLNGIQEIACNSKTDTLKQTFSSGFWESFLDSLESIFNGNEKLEEVDTVLRILFCLTRDDESTDEINKNIQQIKNLCSNHQLLLKVTLFLSEKALSIPADTVVYYLKFIQNLLYNRRDNANAPNRAGNLNTLLSNTLFGILKNAIEGGANKLDDEEVMKVLNAALKIVQNVGRLHPSFKEGIIDEEIGTAILNLFVNIANNPTEYRDILQSAIYAFINIAYTDDRKDKTHITALLKKANEFVNLDVLQNIVNPFKVLKDFAEKQTDYNIQSPESNTPVSIVIERIIGDIQSFIDNGGQEITPTPQRIGMGIGSVASARTPPNSARTISNIPDEERVPGVTPLSSSYTEVAAASPAPLYEGPSPSLNRSPESQIGLKPRNTYKRPNAGRPAWRPAGVTRRLGRNLPRLSTPLSTPPQSPRTPRVNGPWYERLYANRSPPQSPSQSPARSPQLPGRVFTGSPPRYTLPFRAPPLEFTRTSVSPLTSRPSTASSRSSIPPSPPETPPPSVRNPLTLRRGGRRTIRRKRRNIRHYKNGRSRRNS